ncbi:hypothetical protein P9112_007453 [Eukaryota sp. TZLM1-RC]
MSNYIFFDLNGTLIDTRVLQQCYQECSTDPQTTAKKVWDLAFETFQHNAVAGKVQPFEDVIESAMRAVHCEQAKECFFSRLPSCPLYDDVRISFPKMKALDLKLGLLTNTPTRYMNEILAATGISELLDVSLSAEEVSTGVHKPDLRVYNLLVNLLNTGVAHNICYVSAHKWDCLGALNLGIPTIMINREGSATVIDRRIPTITSLDMLPNVVMALFTSPDKLEAIKAEES